MICCIAERIEPNRFDPRGQILFCTHVAPASLPAGSGGFPAAGFKNNVKLHRCQLTLNFELGASAFSFCA
jgi:hypothetical protein